MFEKSINYLLANACVSIRYLVHRDMLKVPISDPLMQNMQGEILQQKTVQKHLSAQHPDGWIGHELHGGNGMDNHIGTLLALGVEKDNPHIQKALQALLTPEIAGQHKNWFPGGEALDADGRGGNRSIIACILATAHVPEDTPPLSDEIQLALSHLSGALQHKSIDDFSVSGKRQRYSKPHVKFPGENHIYILANTHHWQTEENLQMVKKAITHCYSLMKDVEGSITFCKPKEYGGGFVGPFNFNWKTLNPIDISDFHRIVNNPNRYNFGFWLRSMTRHPKWALQTTQPYELLYELIDSDTLMDFMTDDALKGFRHISGIEPHWKSKTSVKCDVTFAVLKACWSVLEV